MSNPNASHWSAIERVFIYIKETPTRDPIYTKGSNDFQNYTNSDWAGNIVDRKSTSGHIFLLEYTLSLARDLVYIWPRGPHQYYLCATLLSIPTIRSANKLKI